MHTCEWLVPPAPTFTETIICICYAQQWAHNRGTSKYPRKHIVHKVLLPSTIVVGNLNTHTRQVHHSEIHVSVNFHNHSVHLFSIAAIPFPANRRKVAHKVKPISANENWLQMIRGHQSHHSNIHKIHNTHIHRRQMCVCLCISKWKILFSTISQICIHLSTFTFNWNQMAKSLPIQNMAHARTHTPCTIKYFIKSTLSHSVLEYCQPHKFTLKFCTRLNNA